MTSSTRDSLPMNQFLDCYNIGKVYGIYPSFSLHPDITNSPPTYSCTNWKVLIPQLYPSGQNDPAMIE